MWVLSVDAGSLLSVVKFDISKAGAEKLAEKHGATDPNVDYLLVRSRIKASLGYVADVLEALYAGEVEGWAKPIIEAMPSADYKYRTIITRDEWKRYMMFEIDGIDYDSHVKEETVKRQPAPKVANLYTALSKTWSAWAALQDTPPYGGKISWGNGYSKPDCKHCGHRELAHTVKGDKCSGQAQGMWSEKAQKTSTCSCTHYEGKPPAAAPKSTASVGASQPDPDYAPLVIDYSVEGDALEDADGQHAGWCPFFDGDACQCADDPWSEYPSLQAEIQASLDAEDSKLVSAGVIINGQLVPQEPEVPGETKAERKRRLERNRRKRRAARRGGAAQAS